MRDPYDVLGLKRSATADEIKRAYRKLAKTWHPDRNADDPKAKERFSEVNAAYEILGEEDKRKAFDRGEIDAEGKPKFRGFEGFGRGGSEKFEFDFGGASPFGRAGGGRVDPRDLFGDILRNFETVGTESHSRGPEREPTRAELTVTLEDVARGGAKRVTLPTGRTVEVNVPKGVAEGAAIRLAGQGRPDPFLGQPGDLLLTVNYAPHPRFRVEGRDLRTRVGLPLADAVLGGRLRVPTLTGEVEMTVPAWTSGGRSLRLKGRGLPRGAEAGDLFVDFDIRLPEGDSDLEAFLRARRGS